MIKNYSKGSSISMQLTVDQLRECCMNYRNAIYQGTWQGINRQGFGIVYISDTHNFIVCKQYQENKLNGSCLFFSDHARCMYGEWANDMPHGINAIKIPQILIIAQYQYGLLLEDKKILIFFQKHNLAILIAINSESKVEVLEKVEIYCSQHLNELIKKCEFKGKNSLIYQSLVKYMNEKMVGGQIGSKKAKMRLINNCYYRYGYDQGLAVIFDDEYKRISVGVHNRSTLSSVGVKYTNENLKGTIEQGIFDEQSQTVFCFNRDQRPKHKIGKLYSKHHLGQINFQNSFYIDHSEQYINYFQQLLTPFFIKQQLSGFITSHRQIHDSLEHLQRFTQSLSHKKDTNNHDQSKYQESKAKQYFNKAVASIQKSQKQFQNLSQKERLDVIQKQIFDSLKQKNVQIDKIPQNQANDNASKSKIINMAPVSNKNWLKTDINFNNPLENIQKQSLKDSIQDKEKKDQVKYDLTPEKSRDRSRKRKIFENIKEDYSPQPTASPFKARMRSKIFDIKINSRNLTPKRGELQRSWRKQEVSNSKVSKVSQQISEKKKQKPIYQKISYLDVPKNQVKIKDDKEYRSPYEEIEISKSSSQINLNALPVTIKNHSQNRSQCLIQDDKDIYQEEKVGKEQKDFRRANNVYKNTIWKGEHANYVYEPINTKKPNHDPYLNPLRSLSRNKSSINFNDNKKIIEDSSPYKRDKMQAYLNQKSYQPILFNRYHDKNLDRSKNMPSSNKKYNYMGK